MKVKRVILDDLRSSEGNLLSNTEMLLSLILMIDCKIYPILVWVCPLIVKP